MDDALQCGNCGIWVHCFMRNCPVCGKALYASLDMSNARPEKFFDLMTSLYNLVADQENAERHRYIAPLSESIIIRRCSIEFGDELHALSFDFESEYEWPEEVRDLYAMCLTNALCGYVFRAVEEFVAREKSPELSKDEINRILVSLDTVSVEIFGKSGYKFLDPLDETDRRVMFCLAMLMNRSHMEYMLADKEQHEAWFSSIIEQSAERAIDFYRIAFGALRPPQSNTDLLLKWHGFVRGQVERGLLFGYIVRLSESLKPSCLQASSRKAH